VTSNKLNILYQDQDLLVLDKPAGLVVDKSNTQAIDTLEDILQKEFEIKLERGGIVHRLDKDTSGVILIAKTQTALDNLQAQFKERKIKKEYLALVHGFIEEGGVIEGAIGRNPRNREKFTVFGRPARSQAQDLAGRQVEGKEATTEYEPLKQLTMDNGELTNIFPDFNKIQMRKLDRMKYNHFTLLKVHPLTGRTHQIRVHLKYAGFPVVGDEKYVGRKVYRLDHRWCPRLFLHAAKLRFRHPVTGNWMEFEAKLPEDLKNTLWTIFSYSLP